jgi:hypothetical protein
MTAKELRGRLIAVGGHGGTPENRFANEWWNSLTLRRKQYYINTHPPKCDAWNMLATVPDEELMFLWAVFKM